MNLCASDQCYVSFGPQAGSVHANGMSNSNVLQSVHCKALAICCICKRLFSAPLFSLPADQLSTFFDHPACCQRSQLTLPDLRSANVTAHTLRDAYTIVILETQDRRHFYLNRPLFLASMRLSIGRPVPMKRMLVYWCYYTVQQARWRLSLRIVSEGVKSREGNARMCA